MSLNSFRSGMGRVTSTPVGKTALFTVGAVLVFSLVYSGLGNNLNNRGAAGPTTSGDDVVATVNGQNITRADYDQAHDKVMQQMGGQEPGPTQGYYYDSIALQQAISASLQLGQAQKMGITVSDQDIKKARQQAVAQSGIAQQLSLPATASISQIDDALSKQGAPSIEDRMPDSVVRDALVLNKLQASFIPVVTPTDAQDFYKEYHTQHILIDNKKVSDAQAQSQAGQILAKAQAPGADFSALARQYSDDPGTKAKGGDDGWIGEDNNFNGYIPEFTKAVQTLQPGGITPAPVKTPEYGYFLIKLLAVRENLPKDFQKNQAQYLAQIKQQRQQSAYENFLNNLKTQYASQIQVTDPALRGDQALADAGQASDPGQRATKLNLAISSYRQALKTTAAGDAGDIQAALGQAYQQIGQIPQAITAYQAAVNTTHDQQLEMTLGQLYEQTKDNKDAITQFQAVSEQAFTDPQIHEQLAGDFIGLKRPDLAAKETEIGRQIQKSQQATTPSVPGGMPLGAQTFTVGGGKPGQTVTLHPASGTPAKPTHGAAQ